MSTWEPTPAELRAQAEKDADDADSVERFEAGAYEDERPYDEQMNARAARGDREATEWVYLNLK